MFLKLYAKFCSLEAKYNNSLPFTPYNSMASVSKLVLVPINMWHRLSKNRKNIDVHSIKMVDIPPQQTDPVEVGEAQMHCHHHRTLWLCQRIQWWWGQALSPLPRSPFPPHKEKGKEEEGEGKEGEPMYIDREDTSKEKTPSEIERDAGMWKSLGKVVIKCKWIHM